MSSRSSKRKQQPTKRKPLKKAKNNKLASEVPKGNGSEGDETAANASEEKEISSKISDDFVALMNEDLSTVMSSAKLDTLTQETGVVMHLDRELGVPPLLIIVKMSLRKPPLYTKVTPLELEMAPLVNEFLGCGYTLSGVKLAEDHTVWLTRSMMSTVTSEIPRKWTWQSIDKFSKVSTPFLNVLIHCY